MPKPTQAEITKAVKAHKINQPILKAEKKGKTITLYLLGGKVVKHTLKTTPSKTK